MVSFLLWWNVLLECCSMTLAQQIDINDAGIERLNS